MVGATLRGEKTPHQLGSHFNIRLYFCIVARKYLLLLTIFIASQIVVKGQVYVGIHGGGTLPQGNYAESRMSDNGWMMTQGHQFFAGAGKGWAGGVDVSVAMPFHPSLEVALSAEWMMGGMNRDVREYYQYVYSLRYSTCSKYEMKLPQYVNIPLLGGVRYAFPVTRGVDFYGEAMAGVSFRRISDWTLAYASGDWTTSSGQYFEDYNNIDIRSYVPKHAWAYRLGAGFILLKKFTLGASFSVMGSAPLEWNRTTTTRYSVYGQPVERTIEDHVVHHEVNPTMVMVQLGYRLNPFGRRTVQDW